MLHIGVAVLGAYFCMLSVWWLVRTTASYYHSLQRHLDFQSSITFPCSSCCGTAPLDGILKICFASLGAFLEFSFDRGYQGNGAFLSRMELGTVFMFLLFCGVMDVLAQWGARSFYSYLDYAGLALLFAATGIILDMRAYSAELPVSSLHSLSAYVAFGGFFVTVIEALHRNSVLFPVMRSFIFLLQGTWWLHSSFLLQQDIRSVRIGETHADIFSLLSIFFVVHASVNFFLILFLWLFVVKLIKNNFCSGWCSRLESPLQNEGIFLENRVYLDYRVLSRFDSDSERE